MNDIERRAPVLHRGPLRAIGWMLALVLALASVPEPARAQSVTTAFVSGYVHTPSGEPLDDARVAAEHVRTGMIRSVRTDGAGHYALRYLPPGEYRLLAEKLGFRPQRISGITLSPGRSLELSFEIGAADPPVESRDERAFESPDLGLTRPGIGRWLGRLEREAVSRERDDLQSIAVLGTSATDRFTVQGLPASFSRFVLDGSTYQPLLHPHLLETPRSPRSLIAIDAAELSTNDLDTEWGDGAAGLLATQSQRGTRSFAARASGSGAENDFVVARFAPATRTGYDVYRAGAEVSGPLIADTAHYAVGAEWRRVRWIDPEIWRPDQLTGARLVAAARDSAETDIRFYDIPQVRDNDVVSGYARFDWLITEGHDVALHADLTAYPTAEWDRAQSRETLALTTPNGFDMAAGIALRSILTERYGNEVRLAFDRAEHDYVGPAREPGRDLPGTRVPYTSVLSDVIAFGVDPRTPATFGRTGFRGDQALSVLLGAHRLKLGVSVDWNSYDWGYAFATPGIFTFADADAFEARRGRFVQATGVVPSASFSMLETGLFLQDEWRVAPGLELMAGLRVAEERLPGDAVSPQTEWARLTGLQNDRFDERLRQWSPRVGFTWDVQQEHRWVVQAGFALQHDDVSPSVLGELATLDGPVRMRRGWGDLGRWPTPPDSIAAPVRGPALVLLGPDFAAPRTSRASFGVSRLGWTSLHLSASYRHTDFLPRRHDVNLIAAPSASDQYGRPVYGRLVRDGGLLGAEPGSNRLFPSFDVVSAIESTGFSAYWDFSASLERRFGDRLTFAASYTFSKTEDDWLSHPGESPLEGFAPAGIDVASSSEWATGTSDFDAPHRATIVARLGLPLPIAPVLTATYRYRSGAPFTPGFRDGVDANGDYSGTNDPAFVDADVPGMAELVERWECLRDQVGRFATRNSCRAPGRNSLDLQLAASVGSSGAMSARVFLDALNLVASGIEVRDHALVLIDDGAELAFDETAGTVTVPLVANPRFGETLRDLDTGRLFRLGLEITF